MPARRMKTSAALLSLALCAALGMNTMPVLAADSTDDTQLQEDEETRTIETAQDFIEVFLCWHNEEDEEDGEEDTVNKDEDEDEEEEEYTPFEEVDADNYQILLDSKEVFDDLDEDIQEEILEIVDDEDSPWPGTYEEMLKMAEETAEQEKERLEKEAAEAAEKEKEEAENTEETTQPDGTVNDVLSSAVQNTLSAAGAENLLTAETQKPQTTVEAPVPAEQTPSTENTLTADTAGETAADAESSAQETDPSSEQTNNTLSENTETSGQETAEEPAEEAAGSDETAGEAQDPAQEESEETADGTENAQDEETPAGTVNATTLTTDAVVQSFINTYLTDNGTLILSATQSNYTRILSGLSAWNQMTTAQRTAVNSWLRSAAGVSFPALFSQAQKIKSSLSASTVSTTNTTTTVSTSVQNHSGFFAITAAAAAGCAVYLLRKLHEKE